MIVNKELAKILSESSKTGDSTLLAEVVSSSLEKHTNYDVAINTPDEWVVWAKINPRDSITILEAWIEEGRDVSAFTDKYQPDLTPCDTFANALGFANHLHLKRFLYRNYGSYSSPMHTYSTTPVRNTKNSFSNNVTRQRTTNRRLERPADDNLYDTKTQQQKASIENEMEFDTYKSKMLAAIQANNRTELASVYNSIISKKDLTSKQKMELRRIYDNAKSAIRNQQAADRQASKGYKNMSARSANRAEKKKKNVEDNATLDNINEVKALIRATLIKEAKNI